MRYLAGQGRRSCSSCDFSPQQQRQQGSDDSSPAATRFSVATAPPAGGRLASARLGPGRGIGADARRAGAEVSVGFGIVDLAVRVSISGAPTLGREWPPGPLACV